MLCGFDEDRSGVLVAVSGYSSVDRMVRVCLILGAFMPGGKWRKAVVSITVEEGTPFAVGDFVGVLLDFLIVAGVIFLVAKYGQKAGLR